MKGLKEKLNKNRNIILAVLGSFCSILLIVVVTNVVYFRSLHYSHSCGYPIEFSQRYCGECGDEIRHGNVFIDSSRRFCLSCGATYSTLKNYCIRDGKKLDDSGKKPLSDYQWYWFGREHNVQIIGIFVVLCLSWSLFFALLFGKVLIPVED